MGERSVIVTGGFGHLGRVVAAAFAAAGAQVARVDFADAPPAAATGLDLPGIDLADPAAAQHSVDAILARFGGIDVLVNIAGGFVWETLADGDPATWERMFRLNVLTALTMSKAALPALLASPSGAIINIGAGAAIRAAAGMGAYTAAKSGIHRLTESLAEELKGSAVTVNAILPTIIDTPVNRKDMPEADFAEWVRPAAIAEVVTFLASPAARAITGALIPVSRGGA